MADDTFIREVDEQLRQDRAQELWSKYGKLIIAGAVLIVVATAAFRGWEYYQQNQAASYGDQYMDAVTLSNEGKHDEAITRLEQIGQAGSGQYPALAKIRVASELAAKGDKQKAMEQFDLIAADKNYSPVFRDVATLRAGLLAVDLADYSDVESRLSTLAAAGGAFRHSAREALGIAALEAGDDQKALEWFQAIVDDANSVSGVQERARTMLDLLAGKGVKASG